MMTKGLFILALLIACTFAQNPLALMSLMGGAGGGAGGLMAGMNSLLNNPYTLCKMTEGVKAVPCKGMPFLCQAQSIKQYKFPDLLTCSPMGIGCCLKDAKSMALARYLSRRR